MDNINELQNQQNNITKESLTLETLFLKKSLFYPDFSLKSLLSGQRSDIFSQQIAARTNAGLKKPIFVIGSPRSGTTLLGSCLAAHSNLIASEESLFLI